MKAWLLVVAFLSIYQGVTPQNQAGESCGVTFTTRILRAGTFVTPNAVTVGQCAGACRSGTTFKVGAPGYTISCRCCLPLSLVESPVTFLLSTDNTVTVSVQIKNTTSCACQAKNCT